MNSLNNTMQTECPECHTIFGISDTQLEQAEGQVRCGHCLVIFNAQCIVEKPPEESVEPKINDNILLDNDNADTVLADVIPAELRAETRNKKRHYGLLGSFIWTLGILSMLAMIVFQYAYHERLRLIQHNELRPWMMEFCRYARCELPAPRDTSRINLNHKNIFSHPNVSNALMISASMVNQAEFDQAFPLLSLKFENVRGEIITGRQFKPFEYLSIPASQISNMTPGEAVSINIEILDPGKDMVSYTFDFL